MNDRERNKSRRAHWVTVDHPGTFAMLETDSLVVDDSYQRDERRTKAREIARSWSWVACGAVSIAKRGNDLFVVDGQHRVTAAKMAGIKLLPCMVFNSSGIKEEARGFLNANTNRKPISAVDRHKAMVVAGDEMAIKVQCLVDSIDAAVGTNSGEVECITAVRRCMEINEQAFSEVWPFIASICKGNRFHSRIVEGIFYIHWKAQPERPFRERAARKRLEAIGYQALLEATSRAAAYYATGGAKVWATGIIDRYNQHLRGARLSLGGEAA